MDTSRYAELFRTESAELLAELDDALLAIEADGDATKVAAAFRSTHTIKGMAGAMGYAQVERIAHAMESLLAELRDGRAMDAGVVAVLFDSSTALRDAVKREAVNREAVNRDPVSQVDPDSAPPRELMAVTAVSAGIGAGALLLTDDVSTEAPLRRRADDALRTIRIDLRRLDALLDLVSELAIARDRLLRVTETVAEHGAHRPLTRAAQDTARLVSALQEQVLQARMVPVGQVFDRFPRLVRDIAHALGKVVHFTLEGREIELDRSLLDAIGDPIVHLLRNALDHGLEDAVTRLAAGKPAAGRLVLRAVRDRASVVIQVEDDGRGIDRNAILCRARADGFVTPDIAYLDDDLLLDVIAHAGFSTAAAVTPISGRGVGLDVVATRVRALAGSLSLGTAESAGTVFTLRLPLTLATMRALLVQVGDEIYVFPAANVVEALEYDPGAIRPGAGLTASLLVRDTWLPVVQLRTRFGADAGVVSAESFAVVVECGGRKSAVLVDALIGQQDIVVKRFDAPRAGDGWFNGATVLGDGRPALIVDLGSLC